MKQYIVIKRAQNSTLEDKIDNTTIYTDENLNVAFEVCRKNNMFFGLKNYKWEIVELTSLITIKAECDMSEDEMKVYKETLNEMGDDLDNIIDYDEWACREFGETRVDYWYTAKNLYTAGYRKITKVEE